MGLRDEKICLPGPTLEALHHAISLALLMKTVVDSKQRVEPRRMGLTSSRIPPNPIAPAKDGRNDETQNLLFVKKQEIWIPRPKRDEEKEG